MIPEVLNNGPVWNLLCGASIIVHVEPDVPIRTALARSKSAESSSDETLTEAIRLIEKVRAELSPGCLTELETFDGKTAREVLRHMLKGAPHNPILKQDVI